MNEYGITIGLGVLIGTFARIYMLRSDYRQYPGYPHGYVTHLSLGFIAAALGSVALPAIAEKQFAAVTFLALAGQQFREVRNMERESLAALEAAELVPRGQDYIEGIARVFEARNYLVILTALVTSSANYITGRPLLSIFVGIVCILLSGIMMRGKVIGNIARVKAGKLNFKGALLLVDEIDIMNIGLPGMREKILTDGLGVVIHPYDDNARATLHNMGQRQAIAHVATTILGTKKDVDTPEFTPMVRKNIDTGAIALFCVPAEKDIESLIAVVERVPVLESARRAPLKTKAGRIAAD
ncbi:YIEGIA family protein [Phosphitispora sp. TUW77]|uniref:YIEGIA family protein n=1 Tax=Phosphitispora sp. TUW77 TaxID=3152361 RepID=UPI003AB2E4BE